MIVRASSFAAAIPASIAPLEPTRVPATDVRRRRSVTAVPFVPTVNAAQPNRKISSAASTLMGTVTEAMIVSAAAAGEATTAVDPTSTSSRSTDWPPIVIVRPTRRSLHHRAGPQVFAGRLAGFGPRTSSGATPPARAHAPVADRSGDRRSRSLLGEMEPGRPDGGF